MTTRRAGKLEPRLNSTLLQLSMTQVPGASRILAGDSFRRPRFQSGQRVLDVASGRGAVLFPCAERVGQTGEVVGVDLADEMVRATNADASQRGIPARVQVMDAERLDFAEATFDGVLCGFGIMFLPDQMRALGEFRRVMKSGGRLAVSTWRVSQTSEIEAAMVELGIHRAKQPGWITEPDDLSKLLKAAGFTDVSVKIDFSFLPIRGC